MDNRNTFDKIGGSLAFLCFIGVWWGVHHYLDQKHREEKSAEWRKVDEERMRKSFEGMQKRQLESFQKSIEEGMTEQRKVLEARQRKYQEEERKRQQESLLRDPREKK